MGGSIAAATGAALALKRTGGVAVACFGDGAMNQGYFFECLNFCKVLSLPIVLVCENNGYGEYTPFEEVTAGPIRARAEVMGVPAETIDGMEVWTVREAAARVVEAARSGGGPQFVEAHHLPVSSAIRAATLAGTGRRASSSAGASATRSSLLRARLEAAGVEASRLEELEASVEAQLAEMERRGLAAPFPEPRTFAEFA